MLIDNNAMGMVPDKTRVDPWYLYYFMRTIDLYCLTDSTTVPALRKSKLETITIPLPPLPEQKRIAAILDKADSIRRKRQQAIRLTEELLRSAFLEMFGDPVTNSKGWKTNELSAVADVNRGKFTRRPRNDPKYYGGEYPFIQTGDLSGCKGILRKWKQTLNDEGTKVSRTFPVGTIAISIAANIGDTAILGFDSYFPDSVVGIEAKSTVATAEYLEYLMRFKQQTLKEEAPETAQKNINLEVLRPLSIMLPSLEAQHKFSRIYRTSYAIADKLTLQCLHCDTLFNTLMQRAFKGEL